jgi:predicted DNA-binding transcriptional regulator AlpA
MRNDINQQISASPAKPDGNDPLMDLNEVANMLGNISTRSVRRLIARGELPRPIKILSTPRLYRSEITAYLERLKERRNKIK